jgi:hypothetical protein
VILLQLAVLLLQLLVILLQLGDPVRMVLHVPDQVFRADPDAVGGDGGFLIQSSLYPDRLRKYVLDRAGQAVFEAVGVLPGQSGDGVGPSPSCSPFHSADLDAGGLGQLKGGGESSEQVRLGDAGRHPFQLPPDHGVQTLDRRVGATSIAGTCRRTSHEQVDEGRRV